MASRAPLVKPLRGWKCPQCRTRSFATSKPRRISFGPEHPRYIEVPEAPQQSLPYRPFIKGRLPVPRSVLSGKDGLKKADDERIAGATPLSQRKHEVEPGSREEWKRKMSEARRRNLREGLKGLRARTVSKQKRTEEWERRDALERAELRSRPEREDERLTSPSHGLDLEKLLHGPLEDPTREERLKQKERNLTLHTAAQRAERLDHLHTLYMNARTFIVTPEQLDAVIEEEFNKDFTRLAGTYAHGETNSMWAYGAPMTLQAMLNREHRGGGRFAYDGSDMKAEISRKRIRRIAEKLTGGKMEPERKEL